MKVLTAHKYAGCPTEISDELLNEDWAKKIHGQTLKRLNERGGLSPAEIYGNINRLDFRQICKLEDSKCVEWLRELTAIPPQQKQGDEDEQVWLDLISDISDWALSNPQMKLGKFIPKLRNNYSITKK